MAGKRKWISWVVLGLFAAGVGLYTSRGTWNKAAEEQAKAAQARAEMRQDEAAKTQLIKQKSELQSASGQERLARERGYMQPGEKPL